MRRLQAILFTPVLVIAVLAGCSAPTPEAPAAPDFSREVAALAEEAWQRLLAKSPFLQVRSGQLLKELPDLTPEDAAADVAFARSLLDRIDAIPSDALSREDALTLALLRWDAERDVEAEPFYWLTFPVTPYAGGFGLTLVHQAIAAYPFDDPREHAEGYLTLLSEYADQLDQMRAHLEGQMERGIFVPAPALDGIVGMFEAFRAGARPLMTVSRDRLEAFTPEDRESFLASVDEAVSGRIEPAFDALLAVLESDRYRSHAPDAVGLAQYPGGEDYYRYLVRFHTTLDVTPEELHELGLERVEELMQEMAAIREELGFEGTQAEFHDRLRRDPRFLAKTPEDVEARYLDYIGRIEPHIPEYFSRTPRAPYGVRRLDAASEGSMTFGYYQAPTADEPTGLYRYNGSRLEERSLVFAGPLIYHELVPGHHFQIALQYENEELPLYRRNYLDASAFAEGWGNYSALLAREMGLLDDPYDRYGWAIFDMFISVRLVVDTGMNLLGWSLEEGRDYMRKHTFQSETEIATESLRYSTDIPAQALAYKAGLEKLLELRERMREKAGERFDIRAFHEAVLGSGALPLKILEEHMEGIL